MKPKVVIRLSKRFLIVAALLILVTGSPVAMVPARASDSKIVYVAICVDSEASGFGGIGSTDPHPTLNVGTYSRTVPSTVAAVFDSDFRNSNRDSFGNSFKLSWFAEMDYLIAQGNFVWADGSPAGVSGYTAIRDLLVNTWGTEMQTYGDSIEYHHHFMIYDGTWQRYDNGPDAGYPEYQMYALDHMIIDDNFYPSSFRSGDWIMPPALSSWLEEWMPFDYTPSYVPLYYPYHPSGMDRWETYCPYAPNVLDSLNSAFAYASDNGNAVFSICTHNSEDLKSQVVWLQYCLNTVEASYPDVSFKYVSAREAMQLALGFTDFTPPTFTVTQSGGTYTIVSSEPLWENHLYIALKYADGTYGHMSATPARTNTWTVTPPTSVSVIGVAGSDLYGNPGTASTLEVGPGKTYSTIQSAITAATAGSTILVYPGTYQEEVTIDKQLNIISVGGAGQTFIDGTGVALNSPGLVKITAPGDVVFNGFTIRNAPAAGGVTVGIFSESSMPGVTYTVSCNNIYGTNDPDNAEDYGFYSYRDSANVILSHNLITQTGANNILFELHTGATEISYNTLDAGVYGSDAIFIMTYDGQDVTALQDVSYNTFNMGTGGPFDNDHRASAISFNTWPISPDAKFTNVVIQGNTINNLESYRRGIGFGNGDGGGGGVIAPLIQDNTITGVAGATESYGIDFIGANAATNAAILNNWIYNCAYGVYLRTTDCALGAQIAYNDILCNSIGLDNTFGSLDVDAQYNYWGNPTGPYNAVSNPSGLGNPVTANVNYEPYLTDPNSPSSLGELIIQKKDAFGNIISLPGATFTVSPNPYGAGKLTVVDNDGNDANAANGIIDLKNVPLGTYTVTETQAPAGFEKDPTPQDVTISSSAAVTMNFTNSIRGDVNSDGKVDILDLRAVAAYYDKTSADPEWPAASKLDLVHDNKIDLYDLVFVASNYGFTYP